MGGTEGKWRVCSRNHPPQRLVWLDTSNHIDLYDVPGFVGPAVDEALAWFYTHLRPA